MVQTGLPSVKLFNVFYYLKNLNDQLGADNVLFKRHTLLCYNHEN